MMSPPKKKNNHALTCTHSPTIHFLTLFGLKNDVMDRDMLLVFCFFRQTRARIEH